MKISALSGHHSLRVPRATHEPGSASIDFQALMHFRFMVPTHALRRKEVLPVCLLITLQLLWLPSITHSAELGLFENQADIGNPSKAGSAVFDAATGSYLVSGGGENMWFTN